MIGTGAVLVELESRVVSGNGRGSVLSPGEQEPVVVWRIVKRVPVAVVEPRRAESVIFVSFKHASASIGHKDDAVLMVVLVIKRPAGGRKGTHQNLVNAFAIQIARGYRS